MMSLMLARWPLSVRVGRIMFLTVAIFGVGTFALALAPTFALAMVVLVVIGASDTISVVIRQTMVQIRTPDEMRGRVFAVNTLFVNCASQIGMFESGITAEWFGAVGSAVLGGAAVLAVVAIWAWRFPTLRGVEQPDDLAPTERRHPTRQT